VGIEIYQCESGCDSGVFTSLAAGGNCLSNNTYGIRSNVTYLNMNGTWNWWGDASGPYHPSQNPGGLGDEVSGDVAFVPWLDDCGGDPIANFQNVRTGGYYTLLQDAVDDALSGDTILTIGPGPFAESSTPRSPRATSPSSSMAVRSGPAHRGSPSTLTT